MTLNRELSQSQFSVLSSRLIIKLSKICFLCTYVEQMIIQKKFNVLLHIQFCNIFTNVFFIIFTDILKIYELIKIYNKIPKYCQKLFLTIIIYQAKYYVKISSGLRTIPLLILLKMCSWGQKTLSVLDKKKILGTIFSLKMQCQKSPFFVASGVVPILYNKPCICTGD